MKLTITTENEHNVADSLSIAARVCTRVSERLDFDALGGNDFADSFTATFNAGPYGKITVCYQK